MIVIHLYMWSHIRRRAYQQRRGFYGVHTFELDAQGVRVTSSDTVTHLKWSAFSKTVKSDRFIVLYVNPPADYIALARSWCTDEDWLRLCDTIQEHFPVV